MFRRHSLDVTDILHPDGQNLLAILVHPPDHPGRIPPEGGQGGDHEVWSLSILLLRFSSSEAIICLRKGVLYFFFSKRESFPLF